MKTKEFIKRIEELGFAVGKYPGFIDTYITARDPETVDNTFKTDYIGVEPKYYGLMGTFGSFSDLEQETQKELLDLFLEYAYTPLVDRLDIKPRPNEYMLKIPNSSGSYVYFDTKDREFIIANKQKVMKPLQGRFIQEEIDELPYQGFIKTLIKEEVKE